MFMCIIEYEIEMTSNRARHCVRARGGYCCEVIVCGFVGDLGQSCD